MAYRVIWTETAAQDLKGIVEFIATDNPEAARRLANAIMGKIETLLELPMTGRMIPEKAEPSLRELILAPYRLIYHLDQEREAIHVTRIWHAASGIPEA